jgi:hypothetical protein
MRSIAMLGIPNGTSIKKIIAVLPVNGLCLSVLGDDEC